MKIEKGMIVQLKNEMQSKWVTSMKMYIGAIVEVLSVNGIGIRLKSHEDDLHPDGHWAFTVDDVEKIISEPINEYLIFN